MHADRDSYRLESDVPLLSSEAQPATALAVEEVVHPIEVKALAFDWSPSVSDPTNITAFGWKPKPVMAWFPVEAGQVKVPAKHSNAIGSKLSEQL